MNRYRIQIIGESGSGLLSTGEILSNALKDLGYNLVSDREYPSLIKGGHSCFSLNFSTNEIKSLSGFSDLMLALDKQSLEAYSDRLKQDGLLIHGYEKVEGLKKIFAKMKCDITAVEGRKIARAQGGNTLMVNIVLVGVLWKTLGLPYEYIEAEVTNKFASKPKLLEIDLKCLKAGFEIATQKVELELPATKTKKILMDGNKAIALGAVHAGLRAYYAYPMSPASTILTHISLMAKDFGLVVKQAEDEITAAQMVVGSMYAGTRAMTATSGGGFDLMTETLSLAGIIENPTVIVIAQRPGPGTGLPTWTAQGDLNLAINAGHGEFGRMVIAVSDPTDCFDLIQHAFNYAEEFQMPVIVLTEKVIAESTMSIAMFEQNKIPIKRGLVPESELKDLKNTDRYCITESGVSKRWLPGSTDAYYFANGDEHWESGEISEDAETNAAMYAKRNRKLRTLENALPEPEVYGDATDADISFVGWGSTKNVMLDIIEELRTKNVKCNYLHYSYVYPLKTGRLEKFFTDNKNIHIAEGNYNGQLGHYISAKTDHKFKGQLLKYNGRPFFIEDLREYIDKNI